MLFGFTIESPTFLRASVMPMIACYGVRPTTNIPVDIHECTDTCIDVCNDMCANVCVDTCTDMCIKISIDM